MDFPQTRYAKTRDGGHIAYKAWGDGSVDLVPFGGIVYNVEIWQEYEPVARFWQELASFTRLIMHDRRGTGLSDASGGLPNLETRAADLLTVLDATGSQRAVVLAINDGGMAAAMAAATEPARFAGLLWMHPQARAVQGDGWEYGPTPAEVASLAELAERAWGTERFIRAFFGPEDEEVLTPDAIAWLGRLQRHACGPSTARDYIELTAGYDVRSVLPNVHVPTVLFERAKGRPRDLAAARATHELMPEAQLRMIGGQARALFFETEPIVELVREFLGVERPAPVLDRVLSTVMFTDIVASTERATALGFKAETEFSQIIQAHIDDELGGTLP